MSDSYTKDPAARLDYTWDWSAWLAEISDTIASATVTVPADLTKVGEPIVGDTMVTQKVSGGALNDTYRMVCQITTGGGLVDERSIFLTIADR